MSFDFSCHLGTTSDDRPLCVSAKQWATHVAVIGPTGQGKSRLMRQAMREHRRCRRGFCAIDTGDAATDFLADVAAEVFLHGHYHLLPKVHLVKLSPFCMARYDTFRFRLPPGIDPALHDLARHYWQHARVHSLLRVCQANTTGSTDFLNQPRAHRVMTNAFLALSTEVKHQRLAMEDVFVFFDPSHKDHKRVVDKVAPLLPREIRAELELLGGFKRLEDVRREVESSINRVRMTLGEGLKTMLSGTGKEPCLDLKEIIERGDYLIVDAQQSFFVNHEPNVTLASLIAMDYCETAMNLPRACRRQNTLFVDETPELLAPLGREIGRWLRILRKYGVACCLSFQDLASMKREEFDLAPVVLGQCGIIISFRSRWPNDNEILSRVLLTGNLVFEPLIHEIERHGGHQFLQIDEFAETVKKDQGRSNTTGTTAATTTNWAHTNTHAAMLNWSTGQKNQIVIGPNGEVIHQGTNDNRGHGLAESSADSAGGGQTSGTTRSQTETETKGWAVTVNHKIVPLPIVIREQQNTGQLKKTVNDQLAKFMQDLHGQDQRQAIVLAPGMKKAVQILTAEVNDPFQNIATQMKAVDAIMQRLYETHPYYFQPSLDPAAADKRLAAFLDSEEDQAVAPLVVAKKGSPAQDHSGGNGWQSPPPKPAERNGENPLD